MFICLFISSVEIDPNVSKHLKKFLEKRLFNFPFKIPKFFKMLILQFSMTFYVIIMTELNKQHHILKIFQFIFEQLEKIFFVLFLGKSAYKFDPIMWKYANELQEYDENFVK